MARIKANLRKSEIKQEDEIIEQKPVISSTNKIIDLGDLVLDLEKIEAKVKGRPIDLTLREFEFLKFLALQKGQAATREKLLKNVWGYDYFGYKNSRCSSKKNKKEN